MKFGKQLLRSRLQEWENEYVDYQRLNKLLKDVVAKESEELVAAWDALLWCEVAKVNWHFERIVASLEKRVESLHETWEEVSGATTTAALQEQRHLVASLANLMGIVQHVFDYSSLNYMAFFKILKKHDKKASGNRRMPLLAHIGQQPFYDQQRLEALSVRVEQLNDLMGGEATARYHSMASRQARSSDKLCFWLGVTCMGLINTGVMWAMPETSDIYSTRKFVGIVPIFRFWFMLILLIWLVGWVTLVLENHKVNYIFLLNVDPKIPLEAQSWLTLAAKMTGVWLILFWAFLADFKFNVFTNGGPLMNAVIYPVLLVVAMAFLLACPSTTQPTKLKMHLIACFGSVFSAPWVPVSFASNLLGDVLTSFTRPLTDFIYSLCYFSKVIRVFAISTIHGPHHHHIYRHMVADGHQLNVAAECCHEVDNLFICSIILSLPYFFRLMQCLRRARDGPNSLLHSANALKYLASLVVTFISVVDPNSMAWFLVCTAATVYSCVWDVKVDWGLFQGSCRLQRSRQMLPPHLYSCFFVLNLVGRSAWALASLVPKNSMSFLSVSQECVLFVLSAFEIYRRAQWAVIRIEHEHLTNSSRFRSLCWVPLLSAPIHENGLVSDTAGTPCSAVDEPPGFLPPQSSPATALVAPELDSCDSYETPETLEKLSNLRFTGSLGGRVVSTTGLEKDSFFARSSRIDALKSPLLPEDTDAVLVGGSAEFRSPSVPIWHARTSSLARVLVAARSDPVDARHQFSSTRSAPKPACESPARQFCDFKLLDS